MVLRWHQRLRVHPANSSQCPKKDAQKDEGKAGTCRHAIRDREVEHHDPRLAIARRTSPRRSRCEFTWLAFCSGEYLKRLRRLIPLPVDMLRHTRDRYGYTDQTVTFADDNGLPQKVELFTSRSLMEASENGFDAEYFFATAMQSMQNAWSRNFPKACSRSTTGLPRIHELPRPHVSDAA